MNTKKNSRVLIKNLNIKYITSTNTSSLEVLCIYESPPPPEDVYNQRHRIGLFNSVSSQCTLINFYLLCCLLTKQLINV